MRSRAVPKIPVSVFSDYICPFCYVGHARLKRLRQQFDLQVNWRYIEIHPDNPPEGRPVSELGYPPEQWAQTMANLSQMAEDEGLALPKRSFTTNSRKALLLAEAAKDCEASVFEQLHERLFETYFCKQQNIGEPHVLMSIAQESGIPHETVERAWTEPEYEMRLKAHLRDATQLGLQGVPVFVVGRLVLPGAVSMRILEEAAHATLSRWPQS